MSVKPLGIDLIIVQLACGKIGSLARGVVGFGANTGVWMNQGGVVPIAFEVNLRTGAIIDVFGGTEMDAAPNSGVDVLTGVDLKAWGATKTTLEFKPMLASPENAWIFGW